MTIYWDIFTWVRTVYKKRCIKISKYENQPKYIYWNFFEKKTKKTHKYQMARIAQKKSKTVWNFHQL